MEPFSEGAALEVRYPEPAIDLAALAACLADAVSVPPLPPPPVSETESGATRGAARERLLRWDPDTGVLTVDTPAVLSRLGRSAGLQALKPTPSGGFLRDAPVPRARTRALLGGRIVDGSAGRLHAALDKLVAHIEGELDAAAAEEFVPAALATTTADEALRTIGQRVGASPDGFLRVRTRVRRTVFADVAKTQRERQDEIARLMAAVEEIDGDRLDHYERMASAVRELLQAQGHAERDITVALAFHREQAQTPGTQLARFFDFLEDAALARIRLQVTFHMMEAVAAAAAESPGAEDAAPLIAYVGRTAGLHQALTDLEGEGLVVNLSREYGAQADFALEEELYTTGFAGCLPVWPAWVAQIFERQQRGPGPGAGSAREVSYRFRVNGINPEDGKTAFVSRLSRIREALLGEASGEGRSSRVRRSLAELVFLAAVVPPSGTSDLNAETALAAARDIVRMLQQRGRAGVDDLLKDLLTRAPAVDAISRALVGVLRTAGTVVTGSLAGRSWDYHVNVLRSLVDLQRIGSSLERPLDAPDSPDKEMIAFFRHVRITHERVMPGNLFSLRVRVRLAERSLRASTEPAQGEIARVPPARWVQVAWRPAAGTAPTGAMGGAEEWLSKPRVEVVYDLRNLGLNRAPDEVSEHLLAAFRCAFAILVHATLFCLFRRLGGTESGTGRLRDALGVCLFRIQHGGRETGPLSGDQGVFAAAQAVELALGRDLDVRMQGLLLRDSEGSGATADATGGMPREKRRGLYGALFGGFPLVIERRGGGELEPAIGLVAFAERPCNEHPERPGTAEAILTMARTYLATAVTEPFRGYEIRCDGGPMDVREAREADSLPAAVLEEIRRLHEVRGCRHVMVLAHRYGSRHIGWAAARMHAPDLPRLVARAGAEFPDLCLYPLARDTFPVTRMRRRGRDEDAFEIVQPDEHLRSYPDEARELRHAYTPVYSLATLHVVGESGKPQSGFCTYFLLRDSGAGPIEAAERIRANLLLSTSPVRADLIALLRGVHYLESQRPATAAGTAQPVLDPYPWTHPETVGHVGEIRVSASRRRAGNVDLSLPAVLERVSRVLHARPTSRP